jgi:hypothetical protein
VVSGLIQSCLSPLVPFRKGRGNGTFDESIRLGLCTDENRGIIVAGSSPL